MVPPENFEALFLELVNESTGETKCELKQLALSDLPDGEVLIEVRYSSLNFKDALATTGNKGVVKQIPLVPGIDASGVVVDSQSNEFKVGDEVMVFHSRFGTQSYGGYSQFTRVPANWVYHLPPTMNMRDAMVYGTGGFTAAQSIEELQRHGITPEMGEVVVTGATGGVGIFAVAMLGKLGYEVVASTGKSEHATWLKEIGAKEVVGREDLNDSQPRPLLSSRWAGAVDTVGGNTLGTILRGTKNFGCVTACGLVGGTEIPLTVFPFILRGITLQGIDTSAISRERRWSTWQKLASEFEIADLDKFATEVSLDKLKGKVDEMLNGKIAGRVVVNLTS